MDTKLTLAHSPPIHLALRCALVGLVSPFALIIAFIVASVLGALVPHMDQGAGVVAVTFLVLAALATSGGLWANALGRLTGAPRSRRLIVAGALSQAVMTILAIVVLGRFEVEFVERGHAALPLHVLFTLLFVPAAFICAAAVSGAFGLALGKTRLAVRMAFFGGVAAALAFLTLNILQDLLGRRVGGPNAAATATMITVTLVCAIGASMALSVVMGRLLAQEFRALLDSSSG